MNTLTEKNVDPKTHTVTIRFTGAVEVNHKEVPEVTVKARPGQNLLEVCQEHDIELPHNCGGVCACSTCHVKIQAGEEFLNEISDGEEDQLDDADNVAPESRLGCQCVIQQDSATLEVEIPPFYGITHEH